MQKLRAKAQAIKALEIKLLEIIALEIKAHELPLIGLLKRIHSGRLQWLKKIKHLTKEDYFL